MTDDTPDAEELLQQSKTQKRHETDPADITVADDRRSSTPLPTPTPATSLRT